MNVDSKNKKEKYSLIDLRNEMSKMAQQTKPEKAYGQLGSLSTDLKRSGYEINCSYRFNSKLLYKASINVFPILCLYFVSIPGTVTRAVIGSSTPRFQSVNTFQARKENNRSFTH